MISPALATMSSMTSVCTSRWSFSRISSSSRASRLNPYCVLTWKFAGWRYVAPQALADVLDELGVMLRFTPLAVPQADGQSE